MSNFLDALASFDFKLKVSHWVMPSVASKASNASSKSNASKSSDASRASNAINSIKTSTSVSWLSISIQIQIHPSLLTEPDDIIDSARLQEWEGVRPCRIERSDKGTNCVNWCHRMKEWTLSRLWLTSPPIGAPYLENIF